MAMEDPRVLLPMSFNPFRSSPSRPPSSGPPSLGHPSSRPHGQTRTDDLENDSWHTNYQRRSSSAMTPPSPQHDQPPSSALSWFSSWTSTSSTAQTASASYHGAPRSHAIIIQDHGHTTIATPPTPAFLSSSTLSPAKAIAMNRGHATPESEEMARQTDVTNLGGVAPVPQNESPAVQPPFPRTTPRVDKPVDGNGTDNRLDLPPYPRPKMAAPAAQTIQSTPRTNKPLLEEFPNPPGLPSLEPTNNAATAVSSAGGGKAGSRSPTPVFKRRQVIDQEELTFPGFSLYQQAKGQYAMGKYSEALDITTECLAFQKSSLGGISIGDGGTPGGSPKLGPAPSSGADAPTHINDAENTSMTALDLRSTFYSGVGSSVRNVVSSLKETAAASSHGPLMGGQQHHPMLSNSIAIMVAQYPTYACVAQTLLLRGHVLAACALCGDDDEASLLSQAVQHVEMAVVIQRKLSCVSDRDATVSSEDLARPLIVLGNMKTKLGFFEEADVAYREAVSILGDVRSDAKHDQLEAKKGDNSEVADDCAKFLKRITGEIAHACYVHGKLYHCQRLHSQAYDCYNRALCMLKKSGVASLRRGSRDAKRIVRSMKSKSALEKLVATYWDDPNTI